jgi:hypothetical protein
MGRVCPLDVLELEDPALDLTACQFRYAREAARRLPGQRTSTQYFHHCCNICNTYDAYCGNMGVALYELAALSGFPDDNRAPIIAELESRESIVDRMC